MIRINLLPPEIGQKRKDEEHWRWVVLGAVLAAALMAGVFVLLQFQVAGKLSEVAAVKQQADGLKQSAARFQVFQQKQADLANRKKVAETALFGRVDWAKLYSEVALILPTDMYLMRIGSKEPRVASGATAAETGKFTADGKALDYPSDAPDLGFKSVAKLMVRLAGLDGIANVWLTQSTKPAVVLATAGTTAPIVDPYITFGISADISMPPTSTASATGVPAPPAP